MRIGRISICLVNVVRWNLEPMTRCACLSRELFTQTDPLPLGVGSPFESSYVYAGARPTVMTDPGGKRFGLSGYQAGRNPIRTCGPELFAGALSFGKNKKKGPPKKSCWDFLMTMYDPVEGVKSSQGVQKGLRARARDLYEFQRTGSWQGHKTQFEQFYGIAKKALEGYRRGGDDGNGCPPPRDQDILLEQEMSEWWLKSSADSFLDRKLNPDDNSNDPASKAKRSAPRIRIPRIPMPSPPEGIADTP